MHLTNFHFYLDKNYLYSKPVKGLRGFRVGYGFGFNGQEKDDEIAGAGNTMTAEFWEYDARLGRRWNIDPETANYPNLSPYSTFNNNPIYYADPKGLEGEPSNVTKKEQKQIDKYNRKAARLEKKTGLKGKDLGDAMEKKYGDKKWMYSKDNSSFNNGTSTYTSIRDLADAAKNPKTKTSFDFNEVTPGVNNSQIDASGNYTLSVNMAGSGAFQINTTLDGGQLTVSVTQGSEPFQEQRPIQEININNSTGTVTIPFNPSQGTFINVKYNVADIQSAGSIGFAAATTVVPNTTTIPQGRPPGISIVNDGNNGRKNRNVYSQLKKMRGF